MLEERYLHNREDAADPVRVAVVGPGFMGSALIRHIERSRGMRVAVVVARDPSRAFRILEGASPGGVVREVADADALDEVVASGGCGVTTSIEVALAASSPEVVIDATGALDLGARLATGAIRHRKRLVTFNAELEGTVGAILDQRAKKEGVTRTIADGDQPGVQLRLAEFARSIGTVPRVLGNIKGMQDVRRTPTTQAGFAARWGQNVAMVTSFADGTKISFEQAVVANALGLTIPSRPLGSAVADHVDTLGSQYDFEELQALGGIVDYVIGALPAPGVFCLAEPVDRFQTDFLELFKLGTGPLYPLYAPYHLCHLEVPRTIALVVGFDAALGSAVGGPRVEVCARAKANLPAGVMIDGIGGFHTYGEMVSVEQLQSGGLVPMGIAAGCRLRRNIPEDHYLRYEDVELPADRLLDSLRAEQDACWSAGAGG